MGITLSFLDFFDLCYQQQALHGPLLALGSLEINEPEQVIQAFAEKNLYWKRDDQKDILSLFRDRYEVTDYHDCDLNDRADIKFDLSQPLILELVNSAMTILNGGTLEHIFNVAQTLINIHEMAQLGATIIHLSPISWYEHGYYNFNPRLFMAVAEVNNYSLVAEAFWFTSNALVPTKLSQPSSESSNRSFVAELLEKVKSGVRGKQLHYFEDVERITDPMLYITFDGQNYAPQREEIFRVFTTGFIPFNTLYLVAYRKNGSKRFVFPYDIQS